MKVTAFLCAALLSLGLSTVSAQGLRIEPLASDNVLIRIAPQTTEKYILIPIEETAPEAQVKVNVDNIQQRTITMRIAQTKIDYYVPFCLDEFRGHYLNLFTHINKDENAGFKGAELGLRNIRLSDTFDTANTEKHRPEYHYTPAYGWMNDPNGMFYKDGEWHLFYQYGPYASVWNNMTWGHAVTKDLIHWETLDDAIRPDANGMIFSGSCIVDKENTAGFGKDAVIAMYTSADAVQSQSIAYSLDNGRTFTNYAGNPVLTCDIPDFRDPNMFWYEGSSSTGGSGDGGHWNLIMSAGQEMRIYSSPDMKNWTEESRFGRELGGHGGVWECPDLMKLKIENGKLKGQEKWVLFCNINPGGPAGGSATQYFIGDFDGHKFTVDDESRYAGKALWQDYGKDHYAAVSFSNAPDGRHTMIAWMSNWQYANNVPTRQYRSGMSICREPFLYEGADKQLYLGSRPSPEYDGQGLDKTVKVKGSCKVTLSNDEGEEFVITYQEKAPSPGKGVMGLLTVDRTKSGETQFSQDFAVNAVAPVHNKLTSLRIFIDNSSVEVFGNNGEVCLTSLVFPKSKYNSVKVSN